MSKIINKNFYSILSSFLLLETISLFGYYFPEFRQISFFVVLFLFFVLSLRNLKYGLYIALAELIIGSKGYLFYFEYGGSSLSIRIAFWLVVMSIWFAKAISESIKNKKLSGFEFIKSKYFLYYSVFFIFLVWGLVNGFLNNNSFNNIFFDFNGWLYFTLIFPIYAVLKKDDLPVIFRIFTISILWLSIKTFILLFLFTHFNPSSIFSVYRWVRTTGVGEITKMPNDFYRIFFQSHIFNLIGFFIVLFIACKDFFVKKEKKYEISIFLSILMAIILAGYSRSNWVGLIIGFAFFELVILMIFKFKKALILNGYILLIGVISILLLAGISKFPYPKPKADFNAETITERAQEVTGEAGVSSRWTLLRELKQELKENPIMGTGFGSTVTYKSSDPRVLEKTADGSYTTYAFEWGWLDIWLKLGLLGVLSYILLILKIFLSGKNLENKWLAWGLMSGFLVLSATSFFSPYTNHPLGIGYIMLAGFILESNLSSFFEKKN